MKESCIVDSSVMVKIVFFKDENLFRKLNSSFTVFIPLNALEESCFIIMRESIKEKFGEERFFKAKDEIFEIAKDMIKKYRLLSNDALIAATCKYYGINKIATFDDDFERVKV